MTAVAGGVAVDTAGEPGRVDTFFLGASVPTGARPVVVSRTNDGNVMYASAATQTAGGNTETTGIVLIAQNGTYAEQLVDDGTPGTNSVRYAFGYSGGNNVLAAGANSTVLNSIDFGSYTGTTARETTAGQGARNVGFSYGTSDDRAAVYLAVRETPGTAPTVTKSFNLSTVAANSTSTLTVTITNPNGVAINGLAFTDTYPSTNLVNASTPGLSNTCGGTATGAAGASSLSLSGGTVAGSSSCAVSVSVTSGTAGSYLNSTGAVTSTNAPSGTAASATLTVTAAAPASCGSGAITGVVNTYYPGVASVSAGANSITVGASSGAGTGLAPNDLVLVMQMQDAGIDTSNTGSYGTPGSINAGQYEYATVSSYNGVTGVVTLSANLVNGYTTAAYGAAGQKTFQVIRVPAYSTATLGAATAKAWDGSSGGVLAFDVTGTLALAGATADVSGKGFRGGAGRSLTGLGTGTNADYRTLATNLANGSKGEGIAGTPRYLDNAGVLLDTTVEGYPNGSYAKGAPANAGGGGSDNDGVNNDENTGGGGGANGGAGGMGGYGWSAPASPGRGIGGAAVSSSAGQLVLGGGGGAGSTNNATGAPGGGLASSGAAGGGIVMVRAGSLSGTGTINVSGANANNTVTNDGSGGGGAAGSVMVSASSGLSGLTVTANGGTGGTNTGGGVEHGPGGGGGGGYAVTSAALAACNVNGGANGTTFSSSAYGATPGSAGSCTTNASLPSSIPGAALGAGACAPSVDHYTIGHSGTGLTCEAEPVTFTAHDSSHARPDAGGRTISITASTSSGTWLASADSCTRTCYNTAGTDLLGCGNGFTNTVGNNGTASYTFAAGESGIRLCLKQNSPVTQNINVSDGTASETSGTAPAEGGAGADPNLVFSDTGIRIYADGNVDTLGSLVAGLLSTVTDATYQPSPQTLTIRALKTSTTIPARCVSLLGGAPATKTIQFAYQCIDPGACHASSAGLKVNGTAVAGSGSVPTPASDVSVAFDASGYGSINLNYWDVGQIKLYALGAIADPTTGGTVSILTGSSNPFLVKPYGFTVIACTGATPCTVANTSPTDGTGSVFAKSGVAFNATVTAVAYGGSVVTPSFGLGTANGTESVALSQTLIAPTGMCAGPSNCAGTLGGTTSILRSSFNSGVASVSDLTWSEVGVMTLTATNSTFEGTALTPAASGISGNIGRFYPDHFAITPAPLVSGCGAVFTYFGQDGFETPFSITAQRANCTETCLDLTLPTCICTTKNYSGATWAKLNLASWASFGFAAATLPAWSTLSTTPPVGSWTAGVGTFTVPPKHQASRPSPAATPVAPTTVAITALPVDADGVTMPAAAALGDALLRFGRLRLINAYGSELLPPRVEYRAEYWDGNRWATNAADDCTTLVAANIASGGLTVSSVGALTNGIGFITFNTAGVGSYDIAINLNTSGSDTSCNTAEGGTAASWPWLQGYWSAPANCGSVAAWAQDPNARIKLGSPRAPYIYLRERY